MKQWRRGFIAIFISVMALLPQIEGAAQPAVVDYGRTGSIIIQKYEAENPEDYGLPATGEEQEINNLQPLANVRFTVTRVQDDDTSPAAATPAEGDDAYSDTIATDDNGRAVFGDLELGVYLVQEEASAAVEAPVEDFLISVPMTNPSGDGWLYDIYVYPKNQLAGQPGIDLSVTSRNNRYTPADLGSSITWLIQSDVPGDIAAAGAYELEVTPEEYLIYEEDSVVLMSEGADTEADYLEPDSDYKVTVSGDKIIITLTEEGRTRLALADTLISELRTTLQVEEAQLPDIMAQPISMDAQLYYTNELGISGTSKLTQSASVYTGGLRLLKREGADGSGLEGTVFQIYRTLEDARNGVNAVPAPGGTTDWQVRTDADGNAGFYGLAYGTEGEEPATGMTTYYLVEVQAPEGYNLLRNPEAVSVSSVSHREENPVIISNYRGFILPLTGGAGTVLFTVIGLALLCLAWLIYKKRRNQSQEMSDDDPDDES